ncbi:MAG: ABC-2 transporter permease [Candidatus Marinimicrobia bacterium]|nr:ABC-2 transporter permease [Candidatus Neomarinimicrobiota bacterium]
MVEMIKKDWILFKSKFLFMVPLFSLSLIILYPKADEGYFVIGLPLVFILSVMLFVQDDKSQSILQQLSRPNSRKNIARGRFLAAWTFTGVGILYLIVLGFALGLLYQEAFMSFLTFLNFETLFIYLWFLTGLLLIAFPLMYLFMGKGLYAMVFLGLGLNVLLGMFFLIQAQWAGPFLFEILEKLVQTLQAQHTGFSNYLISLSLLLLINMLNMRLCEWIFSRKKF